MSIRLNTVVVSLLILAGPFAGFAKDEKPSQKTFQRKLSAFDAAIERVRHITSNDDWKDEDWGDEKLETSLNSIMDRVKKLTKKELLRLPATLDSVSVPEWNLRNFRQGENALFVGKRIELTRARKSVILADEIASITYANDCVIICRGVVEIGHGNGNVILAGHYVNVGFDGKTGRGGQMSVLISGEVVDVAHARNSICAAPRMVEISHGDIQLINSPNHTHSGRGQLAKLTDETKTFPSRKRQHPLMSQLKVTEIVGRPRRNSLPFAVVETPIGEMVVRVGGTVPNPGPTPREVLKGWKLSYVGERFALFRNGNEFASAFIPRK